jgi:hypothetical protein
MSDEKRWRIEATVLGTDPRNGSIRLVVHTFGEEVKQYRNYQGFELPDVPYGTEIVAELVQINRSGDRRIRNWRKK